jgi:hypothetical protein
MVPIQVKTGDIAEMRKPHPCGGLTWEVTRIGADIGLKCLKCGRRVMLPREEFERRVKSIQSPGD